MVSNLCRALEAADELQERYGISAEAIDLRFVNPIEGGPILESVRKTGAALPASDACERGWKPSTRTSDAFRAMSPRPAGRDGIFGARSDGNPRGGYSGLSRVSRKEP
jgi:2-oxoisovalerate dehydrogenase E1 component